MSVRMTTERTDYFAVAAGVVAAVVSALVIDLRFAASVLAGAGIGVLNFALMRMFVGAILQRTGPDRQRAVGLLVVKVIALMAVLYLLLVVVGLPVLAFGLGFMSTPLAIVIDGLVWHGRGPDARAEQHGELH
ncbi:MAG: hypothetical protein EA398_13360 [Deltaproteobacteria bacterium]|nr:MAG: hypothetical protein EA398_13360 [Deltaproteobacteria bacterium]